MKLIKKILKPILFILIFLLIFYQLSELLCRKTTVGVWNHTTKISGFFNEPENEFDILFLGSSNTYCSFNPLVLYDKGKIKSYVLASQQQPVWASYTYAKEALKTQKPKLIVLDTLMFSKDVEYYDDGVNYSFMDDIPPSLNKLKLAFCSAPPLDAIRLSVNFIKYHSRWSELTEDDYKFKRNEQKDYLKGYVLLEDTFKDAVPPATEIEETLPLAEKELEYFDKFVKLSLEENIPLLLVKTPSNATEEDAKLFNTIEKLAKETNIPYIDFNDLYSEIGIDMENDFYDKSHLNYKGSAKFTTYFYELIKDKISPSEDTNNNADEWEKCIDKYYTYVNELNK